MTSHPLPDTDTPRWPLPVPPIPDEVEEGWRDRAACKDAERPDDWYPTSHGARPEPYVVQTCAGCEVAGSCLLETLQEVPTSRDVAGIFGGVSPERRAQLRRLLEIHPQANRVIYAECGTDSARRRHRRYGEQCAVCHARSTG